MPETPLANQKRGCAANVYVICQITCQYLLVYGNNFSAIQDTVSKKYVLKKMNLRKHVQKEKKCSALGVFRGFYFFILLRNYGYTLLEL